MPIFIQKLLEKSLVAISIVNKFSETAPVALIHKNIHGITLDSKLFRSKVLPIYTLLYHNELIEATYGHMKWLSAYA